MTNIALIGATGNIGSRILDEALSRKHNVTAITRDPRKLSAREGMTIRAGSTTDAPALVKILKGHDIVVVSVKWNENDIRRVIDTVRKSGVKRALFVVGAGSLLRADGRTHFDFMAQAHRQVPTGPRPPDPECQRREPHQPRGFRHRHRRRDRETQARAQAVYGGLLNPPSS